MTAIRAIRRFHLSSFYPFTLYPRSIFTLLFDVLEYRLVVSHITYAAAKEGESKSATPSPRGRRGRRRFGCVAHRVTDSLFSPLDLPFSCVGTAPIPEDPTMYEGWDNQGRGGEAWPNEETRWPEGGGDDQGYAHGDQYEQYSSPQVGGYAPGPGAHYPQQEWDAPTTSPVNAPVPAEPAWTNWARNPQGAYGVPRLPRAASQQPSMAPPQAAPPPRSRNDPGSTAGGPTSWQNWGAEAAANGYQSPPRPIGTPYGQQHRVAFAGNESYTPAGDQAEMTPHAQRMIFESLLNSRGGAPKQPQQRSGRSSAQNSVRTSKQHKRSKREKRAHEQNPQGDWGGQQENPGWPQDNSGWGRQEGGWGQQDAGWQEKEGPALDQWGMADAGRGDPDDEEYTDSEGWNDVAGRRNYRQTVSSAFVPAPTGDSPYAMPSRTMAYANGNAQDTLDAFSPGLSRERNTIGDFANLQFLESFGEALKPVENAFFGRDRKARDRIHWQFPHDKDERVRHALEWLHDHAHGIGAFGVRTSFLHIFFSLIKTFIRFS